MALLHESGILDVMPVKTGIQSEYQSSGPQPTLG